METKNNLTSIKFSRIVIQIITFFCLGLDLVLIKTLPTFAHSFGYFLIVFAIWYLLGTRKNYKKMITPSPKTALNLWLWWLFSVTLFVVVLVVMLKYMANNNHFLYYTVIILFSVDIVLQFVFNLYAPKQSIA
ncbi:MAG TPA: hypothetical protein VNG53_10875 [Bacteroidia bacterium]|nr:hypothetical protein [Bacteroidia bacterium]